MRKMVRRGEDCQNYGRYTDMEMERTRFGSEGANFLLLSRNSDKRYEIDEPTLRHLPTI